MYNQLNTQGQKIFSIFIQNNAQPDDFNEVEGMLTIGSFDTVKYSEKGSTLVWMSCQEINGNYWVANMEKALLHYSNNEDKNIL